MPSFYCALRCSSSKQFFFLGRETLRATFCFGVYLFSDLKFISYHLGNTKMDYLPKENIVVKNS